MDSFPSHYRFFYSKFIEATEYTKSNIKDDATLEVHLYHLPTMCVISNTTNKRLRLPNYFIRFARTRFFSSLNKTRSEYQSYSLPMVINSQVPSLVVLVVVVVVEVVKLVVVFSTSEKLKYFT